MNGHANAKTTRKSRELIIHRVEVEGWRPDEVADAMGISVRTVFKWLRRFREDGAEGLANRSSAPASSPLRTLERRVQRILKLRRCRLTALQISRRTRVPRSTVSRLLKRHGLARLRDLDPKEPPNRYERERPGELLHLDVKKLARFKDIGHRIHGDRTRMGRGLGYEYFHVCIDDASRVAYVEKHSDERGDTAVGFFERALAWFARRGVHVERVMTDNGPCYQSRLFAKACQQRAIRHLFTRPYRPRTNGKAERFIQTLLREWAYARPYKSSNYRNRALLPYVRRYNDHRPHGSLGHITPSERLRASL